MAVLIASALRKEFSGTVLYEDVSFKVERADRLALAGPNGAGKTTLLRALARETTLDGGELAWEKGARVALHDQRPPAAGKKPLREYVLAGTADLVAVETELRALEQAMAGGDHGEAMLRRYSAGPAPARARGRVRLARPRGVGRPRPGLHRRRPRPAALDVLGRRADTRVARPRAGVPTRPAAARRADEPSRHRVARVARGHAADARRRRDPRRPRPVVPGGGHDRRARARGRQIGLLPRRLAQLAHRARGPGAASRHDGSTAVGGDRAAGAIRRAVSLQGVEGHARPSRSSSRSSGSRPFGSRPARPGSARSDSSS